MPFAESIQALLDKLPLVGERVATRKDVPAYIAKDGTQMYHQGGENVLSKVYAQLKKMATDPKHTWKGMPEVYWHNASTGVTRPMGNAAEAFGGYARGIGKVAANLEIPFAVAMVFDELNKTRPFVHSSPEEKAAWEKKIEDLAWNNIKYRGKVPTGKDVQDEISNIKNALDNYSFNQGAVNEDILAPKNVDNTKQYYENQAIMDLFVNPQENQSIDTLPKHNVTTSNKQEPKQEVLMNPSMIRVEPKQEIKQQQKPTTPYGLDQDTINFMYAKAKDTLKKQYIALGELDKANKVNYNSQDVADLAFKFMKNYKETGHWGGRMPDENVKFKTRDISF